MVPREWRPSGGVDTHFFGFEAKRKGSDGCPIVLTAANTDNVRKPQNVKELA